MKINFLILCLVLFFANCKQTDSIDNVRKKLSNKGFNETIWKFDSLACYPKYRQVQAGILNENKALLLGKKVDVALELLGQPYVLWNNNSTNYYILQYSLENMGVESDSDRKYYDKHGLDIYKLEIFINVHDSTIVSLARSI